eukprot:1047203-Rhodomonas_salina.1
MQGIDKLAVVVVAGVEVPQTLPRQQHLLELFCSLSRLQPLSLPLQQILLFPATRTPSVSSRGGGLRGGGWGLGEEGEDAREHVAHSLNSVDLILHTHATTSHSHNAPCDVPWCTYASLHSDTPRHAVTCRDTRTHARARARTHTHTHGHTHENAAGAAD